ncbi:MAG: diguanylate cyclase [Polyangiaceae bacterium]
MRPEDPEPPVSSARRGDTPALDLDTPRSRAQQAPQTPYAIRLRETQRAFAAVRQPLERRVLTIISGPNAGTVFTLHREMHLLGRGDLADMQVDDPDISRLHARFRRCDDGHYAVEDASSTNGTFLGAERVQRAVLKPGDRIQCGSTLVLRYSITDDIEQELHERMHASATRDFLTRVHNRVHLLERLGAELAHARRHGAPLSLLMLDVDGMRRVNEERGQEAGDILLRAIAGRLQRLVRAEDLVARYGGDEFAVLARSTPLPAATQLAERLRAAVRDIEIPAVDVGTGAEVRATLSAGVASMSELVAPGAATTEGIIALATGRLHRAKAAGYDGLCAKD